MPSPEHAGGSPHHINYEPTAPQLVPFMRAARFAGEQVSGHAYAEAQHVIYEAQPPADVSVFRLQLDRFWHVAALGLLPPAPVLQALEDILAAGEPVTLPAEVVSVLQERRAQAIKRASWVERHFRPGQSL